MLVGQQEEHTANKNRVMRCLCGYLSAVNSKWFACVPADATAIPSSLASLNSRMVVFLVLAYPGCPVEEAIQWVFFLFITAKFVLLCPWSECEVLWLICLYVCKCVCISLCLPVHKPVSKTVFSDDSDVVFQFCGWCPWQWCDRVYPVYTGKHKDSKWVKICCLHLPCIISGWTYHAYVYRCNLDTRMFSGRWTRWNFLTYWRLTMTVLWILIVCCVDFLRSQIPLGMFG